MSGREQRQKERFPIGIPVRIVVTGDGEPEIIDSVTENISAGGVLVQAAEPLPLGTKVELDLVIPIEDIRKMSGKNARIKISGSVVRLDTRFIAIQFGREYKVLPIPDERDTRHGPQ